MGATTTTPNWFREASPLISRLQWFISLGRTGLGDCGARYLPGLTAEIQEAYPYFQGTGPHKRTQGIPLSQSPSEVPSQGRDRVLTLLFL